MERMSNLFGFKSQSQSQSSSSQSQLQEKEKESAKKKPEKHVKFAGVSSHSTGSSSPAAVLSEIAQGSAAKNKESDDDFEDDVVKKNKSRAMVVEDHEKEEGENDRSRDTIVEEDDGDDNEDDNGGKKRGGLSRLGGNRFGKKAENGDDKENEVVVLDDGDDGNNNNDSSGSSDGKKNDDRGGVNPSSSRQGKETPVKSFFQGEGTPKKTQWSKTVSDDENESDDQQKVAKGNVISEQESQRSQKANSQRSNHSQKEGTEKKTPSSKRVDEKKQERSDEDDFESDEKSREKPREKKQEVEKSESGEEEKLSRKKKRPSEERSKLFNGDEGERSRKDSDSDDDKLENDNNNGSSGIDDKVFEGGETFLQKVSSNIRESHIVDDPAVALGELIDNSIQALLDPSLENESDFVPQVKLSMEKTGPSRSLVVFDNGCGMTEAQLKSAANMGGGGRDSDAHGPKKSTNEMLNPIRNPFQVGRIGRYGIGKMAAYSLGKKVFLETKHANSKNQIWLKTEEVTEDKFIAVKISHREIRETDAEISHWTRVKITDILPIQHKVLSDRPTLEKLAAKYSLLIHGKDLLPEKLASFVFPGSKEHPFPKIQLLLGSVNLEQIDNIAKTFCEAFCNLAKQKKECVACWELREGDKRTHPLGVLCVGYFGQEVGENGSLMSTAPVDENGNEIGPVLVFVNGIFLLDEKIKLEIFEPPQGVTGLQREPYKRLRGILFLTTHIENKELLKFENHKRKLEESDIRTEIIKGVGRLWAGVKRDLKEFLEPCSNGDTLQVFSHVVGYDFLHADVDIAEWKAYRGPLGDKRKKNTEVFLEDWVVIGDSKRFCKVVRISCEAPSLSKEFATTRDGAFEVLDSALNISEKINPLKEIKKVIKKDDTKEVEKETEEYKMRFPAKIIVKFPDDGANDDQGDEEIMNNTTSQEAKGRKKKKSSPVENQNIPQHRFFKCGQNLNIQLKIESHEGGPVRQDLLKHFRMCAAFRPENGEDIPLAIKPAVDFKNERCFEISDRLPMIPGDYTLLSQFQCIPHLKAEEKRQKIPLLKEEPGTLDVGDSSVKISTTHSEVHHIFASFKSNSDRSGKKKKRRTGGSSSSFDENGESTFEIPPKAKLSIYIFGRDEEDNEIPLEADKLDKKFVKIECKRSSIKCDFTDIEIVADDNKGAIIRGVIFDGTAGDKCAVTISVGMKASINSSSSSPPSLQATNNLSIRIVDSDSFFSWGISDTSSQLSSSIVHEKNQIQVMAGGHIPKTKLVLGELLNQGKFICKSTNGQKCIDPTAENITVDLQETEDRKLHALIPPIKLLEDCSLDEFDLVMATPDGSFESNPIHVEVLKPSFKWDPVRLEGVIARPGPEKNVLIVPLAPALLQDLGSIIAGLPKSFYLSQSHESEFLGDERMNKFSFNFSKSNLGGQTKPKWGDGKLLWPLFKDWRKEATTEFSMFGEKVELEVLKVLKLNSSCDSLVVSPPLQHIDSINLWLHDNSNSKLNITKNELASSSLGIRVEFEQKQSSAMISWGQDSIQAQNLTFYPQDDLTDERVIDVQDEDDDEDNHGQILLGIRNLTVYFNEESAKKKNVTLRVSIVRKDGSRWLTNNGFVKISLIQEPGHIAPPPSPKTKSRSHEEVTPRSTSKKKKEQEEEEKEEEEAQSEETENEEPARKRAKPNSKQKKNFQSPAKTLKPTSRRSNEEEEEEQNDSWMATFKSLREAILSENNDDVCARMKDLVKEYEEGPSEVDLVKGFKELIMNPEESIEEVKNPKKRGRKKAKKSVVPADPNEEDTNEIVQLSAPTVKNSTPDDDMNGAND